MPTSPPGKVNSVLNHGDLAWVSRPLHSSSAIAASIEETFISYPAADAFLAHCELRVIAPKRLDQPHLALMADDGNGKGAIIRWLCRRHEPFYAPSQDSAIVPVVVFELPPEWNDVSLRNALAKALGLTRCSSWRALEKSYVDARVRLIVLRHAEELGDWPVSFQSAAIVKLQSFADATLTSLLICGTPQLQMIFAKHKDLFEWTPQVRLPLWTATSVVPYLGALASAWHQDAGTLESLSDVLVDVSRGRIGDATRRLRRAMDTGIAWNRDALAAALTR